MDVLTNDDFAEAFDKVTANEEAKLPEQESEDIAATADDQNTDQGETEAKDPAKAEEQEQPVTPHPRWSAEQKEAFSKLPRDQQEFLLGREKEMEAEFTRKTQEFAEQRKSYSEVDRIIEERRPISAQYGTTPEAELKTLYDVANYAKSDPAGYIQWFAQQHGLNAALPASQEAAGEEITDPNYLALKQQVDSLTNQLKSQENAKQQEDQQAQLRVVEAFKSDPANQHFDAVADDLRALIPIVRQANPSMTSQDVLKEAYSRAVYANPKVRELIIAEQQKADAEKRVQSEKETAKRARDAQGMFVKSNDGGQARREPETLDEIMSQAYDKAVGA